MFGYHRFSTALFLLVVCLFAAPSRADEADEKEDAKALGELNEAYVAAFNKQDVEAVSKVFTEDSEFLMLTGVVLNGREMIAKGHAAFFVGNPKAKVSGKQHKRTFLSPDVVVARGEWKVADGPSEYPAGGLWTAVQVKRKGEWRYASISLIIPVKAKGES